MTRHDVTPAEPTDPHGRAPVALWSSPTDDGGTLRVYRYGELPGALGVLSGSFSGPAPVLLVELDADPPRWPTLGELMDATEAAGLGCAWGLPALTPHPALTPPTPGPCARVPLHMLGRVNLGEAGGRQPLRGPALVSS